MLTPMNDRCGSIDAAWRMPGRHSNDKPKESESVMNTLQRFSFAAVVALLAGVAAPALAQNVNAVDDDAFTVDNNATSPKRLQPEPTIAMSPADTDIILGGAQDFRKTTEIINACGSGNRWNGLYRSTDGGANFDDFNGLIPGYCADATGGAGTEQTESAQFGLSTNTDPVLVFDDFGNAYYSHITFNDNRFDTTPPSDVGVLFVSTFRDDGTIYAKTIRVPSGSGLRRARFEAGPGQSNFDDKQWMAADNNPASEFYGRVYITWTKFAAQGGQSSIWLSSCGGNGPGNEVCEEFTRGHVINKPVKGGLVQESFPAVAPNGDVYVAFLQFQGGFGSTRPHIGIWIMKSTDGGETFTQRQVADIQQIPSPIPPTNPLAAPRANDGFNSFRTGTAPSVDITEDGKVHLVWGEWVGGSHAEIMYTRSTDGGQTWSTPIAMNDDPTGHQFFPNLDVAGNNVHVAWFDSRENDAGDPITDLHVFYNRSEDSGASFLPDEQITDVAFDPNSVSRFPVFCAAFIGDYIDIDAVNGKVAIIWSDNRNVVNPLTVGECNDFRTRPTDPSIQARLNDGALDQDAFVEVFTVP